MRATTRTLAPAAVTATDATPEATTATAAQPGATVAVQAPQASTDTLAPVAVVTRATSYVAQLHRVTHGGFERITQAAALRLIWQYQTEQARPEGTTTSAAAVVASTRTIAPRARTINL